MKKTYLTTVLVLVGLIVNVSCDRGDQNYSPCNSSGGLELTNQTGRIYKWTNSEPYFYYIGNEQQVSSGINGGFIPCNKLPTEFQQEGLLVKYSGMDKGTWSDASDPLFGYINIKTIEKKD